MGRPRIYQEPRVATAVRLPASLRDQLQTVATERDVSVNLLVTRAVSDYLRRLPPASDYLRRLGDESPSQPARGPAKTPAS
jgi:hypothetical protein